MNKLEKEMLVLTNYRKVLHVKKNEIVNRMNNLEKYKTHLKSTISTILRNVSVPTSNNALLSYPKKSRSNNSEMEIFIFNSLGNNLRLIDQIKELRGKPNTVVVAIYDGKVFGDNAIKKEVGDFIYEYKFENFGIEDINKVIDTIMHVADHFMNVKKNVSKTFLTSNLSGFELKRTQIAPMIDDKLSLDGIREKSLDKNKKNIEIYIPTYSRWVQEIFERYIWAKMRCLFVEFEVWIQLREILKIDGSLDILDQKLERIEYELSSIKIKESSDELSIIQGGEDAN